VRSGLASHRDDLFKYWAALDEDNKGIITSRQWREGVCQVLDLPPDLPWDALQPMILGGSEQNGWVNYVEYVNESLPSSASISGSMGRPAVFSDEVRRLVVNKFFETIISKDMSMRETMAIFDQDGDGYVTGAELRKYLVQVHSDLPDAQVEAILRAMHYEAGPRKDGSPAAAAKLADSPGARTTPAGARKPSMSRRLSVGCNAGGGMGRYSLDDFLGRFQLIFREDNSRKISEEQRNALLEIGKRLINRGSLTAVFARLDTNGNGYVEEDEFMAAMKSTQGLEHLAGRRDVFQLVDINGDGRLNLVEFCASFEVARSDDTEQMAQEIWDSILLSLRRNSVRT